MKKVLPNLSVMKRVIPIVAVAVAITACNSNPRTAGAETTVQTAPAVTISAEDSLVLSQFHAWKAENELKDAREFLGQGAAAAPAAAAVATAPAARSTRSASTTRRSSSSGSSASRSNGTVYNSESANTARAPQKKGWSKAAKGAVIGGVAGGAAGAVINKRNRVVGGVVGAVLGAGGGYAIGRGMDKRDGRY
ncbi:MAG TPA: glycine zipper domain-containing protein [Flavisolibacter sp.]|nr:glycine zipper domain-containing protein [Flavisolibacter sp.]